MQRYFLDPTTRTIPDGTHGYILFEESDSFSSQNISIGANCSLLIIVFNQKTSQTITLWTIGESSQIRFLSLTLGEGNIQFSGNLTEKGSRLDALLLGLTNDDASLTLSGELNIKAWNEPLEGSIYQEIILLGTSKKIHSFPTLKLEWEGATGRHGLSIHRLSDAMLFFLTARGVEKEHALEMLVLGKVTSFLGDTIPEILLHSFQRAISTLAGLSKKR